MIVKIHYQGEYEDELIIKANTLDEIREKAKREGEKRNWDELDCWSEIIEE